MADTTPFRAFTDVDMIWLIETLIHEASSNARKEITVDDLETVLALLEVKE